MKWEWDEDLQFVAVLFGGLALLLAIIVLGAAISSHQNSEVQQKCLQLGHPVYECAQLKGSF